MGHSLVSGRPYSPILDPRSSGEQNKGMCSMYDPTHGIRSTFYEFGKEGIVGELIRSSCFQVCQIYILSGLH